LFAELQSKMKIEQSQTGGRVRNKTDRDVGEERRVEADVVELPERSVA
jgi:hypothetical protein